MSSEAFPQDKQALLERMRSLLSQEVPHNQALGLVLEDVGAGEASVRLPYQDFLVGNPETGVLHGGAVTSLIDVACGVAVFVKLMRLARIATLDLRVDSLRPARPGKDVTAQAECYKVTRSVAFVRALAHDGDAADAVASAQGTFIIMED
jgi:uncharacterized protein (TIGR00369 family)